jgi:hypothetical protein
MIGDDAMREGFLDALALAEAAKRNDKDALLAILTEANPTYVTEGLLGIIWRLLGGTCGGRPT